MNDLKNPQRRKAYANHNRQVVMDTHDVAMDRILTEKMLSAGKGRQFSN